VEAYDDKTSEPELRVYVVKFVGGTTAVTKVYGKGVTVTYISTGVVDLVFATPPGGAFVGVLGRCFEATTQSGVKGYTCVAGVPSTAATGITTLRLNITGASESLVDLAALQWLTLQVAFKATGA
jgi:hypothetical protein